MNPTGSLAQALCSIALMVDAVAKHLDRFDEVFTTMAAKLDELGDDHQNILDKLDSVLSRESRIQRQGETIMATLADVQAKVAAEGTVVDSAVVLLKGLKDQLDAAIASNDPAALQALSDSIGSQTDTLATAVATNTPAA